VALEQSDNKYKHKNSNSLYAHFSAIDVYDCNIFPDLKFASPIHIKLTKGQSLYIPKKWWHWVKTTKKTFAINYWFNNSSSRLPFTFNVNNNIDISVLDKEVVYVWNSSKYYSGERIYKTTFREFYDSGMDDRCVITLDNYAAGEKNTHVKNKLASVIAFPSDARLVFEDSYDYNVWVASNKHDTGLHYDDEDGILTVVEGEKYIMLFSPSDSRYLYPYEVSYEWRNSSPTNFRYNTFRCYEEVDGVCSAELLYVTCHDDARVLNNISKLFYKYPHTNLIWGVKKDGNNYRWEIYYYTLREDIRIRSWDILGDKYDISEEEHYYFKHDDVPLGLPFWGYGKFKKQGVLYPESKIFVIDTYRSFYDNYNKYMDKLGYGVIKQIFRDVVLEKYTCYEICIHNKKPDQIFIQYLGISNQDFLQFLIEQAYPANVVDFVQKNINANKYYINNEITIVYDIKSQQIVRSGFYGNL
jgi:hypothetical protein